MMRLILAIALAFSSNLCWAEAYYWVDENGKRQYSDRVPPSQSQLERKVIDERGFTVQTLPKQQSEEEIAAAAAAKADAEKQAQEEKRQRAEDAAYDTLLRTTYEDVSDIERARDDRLTLLDASIQVEVQAKSDNNRHLGKLRDEERALLDSGKPVPKKLRKSLEATVSRITNNERNIAELKKQRASVEAEYNGNIRRYLELQSAAN